jgi:hypothetical protein
VLVDATNVYFVGRDPDSKDHGDAVFAVDKAGSHASIKLASITAFEGFVLDRGILYVSDRGDQSAARTRSTRRAVESLRWRWRRQR